MKKTPIIDLRLSEQRKLFREKERKINLKEKKWLIDRYDELFREYNYMDTKKWKLSKEIGEIEKELDEKYPGWDKE